MTDHLEMVALVVAAAVEAMVVVAAVMVEVEVIKESHFLP